MGGRSTLISSGIAILLFLARCKEVSAAFLPIAAKKLAELICYGFHIFWINLPFVDFERESAISYHPERTRIFLKQSHFFECVVSLSYKKGFLNQVARFFKISSVNGVPCLMKSCEEANSRFHEILDFLVDKTTGSPTNLNRFHGSMDV